MADNHYFLMRHGESVANHRGLIVSCPDNAVNGYGLTASGARQVTDSALATQLDRRTIIVSSDYLRARQTAELMHEITSAETSVELDPGLRERNFGEWELRGQAAYQTVWKNDLENPNLSIGEVESVADVLDRARKVISRLNGLYQNKSILLVGHGDVLQILLAFHHRLDPRFHRSLTAIKNAEIRILSDVSQDSNSGLRPC